MSDKEQSRQLAKQAIEAIEDRKGSDIRVIDISEISPLGDYFIIAGGKNTNQIQAIADAVEESLGRSGCAPRSIEGYDGAKWVLMDFGDVIVHIFDSENRLFYDLERIWRDGKAIDADAFINGQ